MAYDLFFLPDFPAFGVGMPTQEWEVARTLEVKRSPEIDRFLGAASRWESRLPDRIGFGKIAHVLAADGRTEVRFPIHRRTIRKAMLTLGTLLTIPTNWDQKSLKCGIWLEVDNSLLGQRVSGWVTEGFREGLSKITEEDLQTVWSHMHRTWKATAPREVLYFTDFSVRVDEGSEGYLFEIGFSDGSSCDVSMYPENPDRFSCHNMDSLHYQATCLAGLFSLYERVKAKA